MELRSKQLQQFVLFSFWLIFSVIKKKFIRSCHNAVFHCQTLSRSCRPETTLPLFPFSFLLSLLLSKENFCIFFYKTLKKNERNSHATTLNENKNSSSSLLTLFLRRRFMSFLFLSHFQHECVNFKNASTEWEFDFKTFITFL